MVFLKGLIDKKAWHIWGVHRPELASDVFQVVRRPYQIEPVFTLYQLRSHNYRSWF